MAKDSDQNRATNLIKTFGTVLNNKGKGPK